MKVYGQDQISSVEEAYCNYSYKKHTKQKNMMT